MGDFNDKVFRFHQEGPSVPLSGLYECRDHVKFETYLVILFSAHPFHSLPFSLLGVSAYLLHVVQTAKLCHGILRDSH